MFARLRKRRALILGLLTLLTLVGLAVAPWALWHIRADRPLDVVVVDKTVAKPNYREHEGLIWFLRHEKVVQRETGLPLVLDRDYAGYQHTADGQTRIVPIPDRPTDFVYIADTYGVYEDDLLGRPLGLKSDLIYGGLSVDEVRTIRRNLRPGATLVGEFNCIASPTVGKARAELSEALGVEWTGWIGRHFAFLDLTVDLPLWIPRTWKRQTGDNWQFRGPGYVFVNEQGHLVVLIEGIDTPTPAMRIQFDEANADRYGTVRSQVYDYWFEIMKPRPGSEVLAKFEFELTESGRAKTQGVPISGPIPAIIRAEHARHRSYYFVGDFADQPNPSSAYRYRWLPKIKATFGAEHRDDQQAFFWRIYVPMMQRILAEAERTARERSDAPDGRS